MRTHGISTQRTLGLLLVLCFCLVESFAQGRSDSLNGVNRGNGRKTHTPKIGLPSKPEAEKDSVVSASAKGPGFNFSNLKQGDAVRIAVFPDSGSFINGVYEIGADNDIVLPLLGRTKINGMTENEFAEFINKAFVDQMRYPGAQIQPLIRLSFLGGFHQPGLLYVNPTRSLWDAVRQTGGPLREDGFDKMKWERNGALMSDSIQPGIQSGKSLYELGFLSGDVIEVTPKPNQQFWDHMNSNVFPALTFLVATVTASFTVYSTYHLINEK
jgi:protein involved in polysaccharide export with SLBB domain